MALREFENQIAIRQTLEGQRAALIAEIDADLYSAPPKISIFSYLRYICVSATFWIFFVIVKLLMCLGTGICVVLSSPLLWLLLQTVVTLGSEIVVYLILGFASIMLNTLSLVEQHYKSKLSQNEPFL